MKRLLAIFALLFASPAFAAQNLAGQWTIHSNIAGNAIDQQCAFSVTDGKIGGTCKFQDKDQRVTGTVDGNKINWQYETDFNGTSLTLIYTVTPDTSGKIAGTVKVQPFNFDGDFTATPAAASPPSASPAPASSESQTDSQCAYLRKTDMNSPSIMTMRDGLLKPGGHMDLAMLSKSPDFSESMKKIEEQEQLRKAEDWAGLCYYKADNAAQASKVRPKVVFMGDSITEFWQFGDPSLFSASVLNRGISGQTTSQILLRFYDDVVSLHPSVVHLMGGTNDVAQNGGPISDEDILNNIRVMIELAKADHIRVVLASIPPMAKVSWRPSIAPAARVATLNEQLRTLASETRVQFVDYYSALRAEDGGIRADDSNDGVHPNQKGYAVMRPIVDQAIEDVSSR